MIEHMMKFGTQYILWPVVVFFFKLRHFIKLIQRQMLMFQHNFCSTNNDKHESLRT